MNEQEVNGSVDRDWAQRQSHQRATLRQSSNGSCSSLQAPPDFCCDLHCKVRAMLSPLNALYRIYGIPVYLYLHYILSNRNFAIMHATIYKLRSNAKIKRGSFRCSSHIALRHATHCLMVFEGFRFFLITFFSTPSTYEIYF